jgi:D-alanyl-D-alanine carboxypeptidase-like protein
MSAGVPLVDRDLSKLAPKFREAVDAAVEDCHVAGLDVMVYEAMRSAELQALYYARGRTIIPPTKPVTNARSHLYSWHAYGLAVDVVSVHHGWDKPWQWWVNVADCFQRHGCKWGGLWRNPDPPHHQWGLCKPSPSDRAREILANEGLEALWKVVGAD